MTSPSYSICPPTAVPRSRDEPSPPLRRAVPSEVGGLVADYFLAPPPRTPNPQHLRRMIPVASTSASAHEVSSLATLAQTSLSRFTKPTLRHRVYNLRCATCDTFFSDRGMRAILLLQPDVVLFSSDSQPVNCGPVHEQHGPTSPERTCQCLTSTFGCFNCGTSVGYHVLQPCARCDDSVREHQSQAHQHRYVFHQHAVSSTQRTYYPAERGVKCHTCESRTTPPHSPSSSRKAPVIPADIFQFQLDLGDSPPLPSPPVTASKGDSFPFGSPLLSGVAEDRPACFCLKANDPLYWHNLNTAGSVPEAVDPLTRAGIVEEKAGR